MARSQSQKREWLHQVCSDIQGGLCVVCGRGLHGGGHLHEAIIKRGDLPGDGRIFVMENCCVLHDGCHENTKRVDRICIKWLVHTHGPAVVTFIDSLGMKSETWRVRYARRKYGRF